MRARKKTSTAEVGLIAPSRSRIPSYQALAREVEALVADINWQYAQGHWLPIIYHATSAAARCHHRPRLPGK